MMVGEGGAQWLSHNLEKPFRAVPHALYANLINPDSTRHWYGKMILPPSDAIIPTENIRYDVYRELQVLVASTLSEDGRNNNLLPSACSSFTSSRRKLIASNTCTVTSTGAQGIMCWMGCMSVSSLTCSSSDAVCYDTVNKNVVSGDIMCPSGMTGCQPICSVDIPQPKLNSTSSSDDYCSGTGSIMYMDGFRGIGTSKKGETVCLNFLFLNWTLNEPVKFAFACIGTLLAGVLVQFIGKYRLKLHAEKWSRAYLKKGLLILLFGVQVTLGYFLMLLAMTYSTELFCMVCLGLTIGYAFFLVTDKP
jgi:Ctr copper transporter family